MSEDQSHARVALLGPDPGWEDLPMGDWEYAPAFLTGDAGDRRLIVRYYQRVVDQVLVGKAWFGPGSAGPPGHAHGGSIAAVLDEAMGPAAWVRGHAVLAAKLTINFRSMLPLGTIVRFEALLDKVDGRKVHTCSELTDAEGKVIAEGSGLFIVLRGTALPPLRSTDDDA